MKVKIKSSDVFLFLGFTAASGTMFGLATRSYLIGFGVGCALCALVFAMYIVKNIDN
ncbi:MAG: hypothetical protein WCX12_01290 [Candidatus Paceibacterota bacterium]|jgi:hypothetical protein